MNNGLIEKTVQLRKGFDAWFKANVKMDSNIYIYTAYAFYILCVVAYVMDDIAGRAEEKLWRKIVFSILKITVVTVIIYAAVFLAAFIFPESRFTFSMRVILTQHPGLLCMSFIGVIAAAGIACFVEIISLALRTKK